ncbi:MAG: hypothetical protein ACRC1T_05020 [Clostridium chrysemydis]|uniref:hypothetical protein n=1 Tax=Clostridium chrysemydis TaxID=2665504 RepID=UPI003F2D24F7
MLEIEERNTDMEEILEGAFDLITCDNLDIKDMFQEQQGIIKELKHLKETTYETLLKDIPLLLESIGEIGIDFKDKENLLNILLKELTYNKDQYIEFLEDKLNTFCTKEDICNCCGTDLLHNNHEECIGEYQGSPAYEEYTDEGYCPYGCLTI